MCDHHSSEVRALHTFKMSMLPYLKSLNAFFSQLASLKDQSSVHHMSSLFLKIWSVISLMVAMEQDPADENFSSLDRNGTPQSTGLGFGDQTHGTGLTPFKAATIVRFGQDTASHKDQFVAYLLSLLIEIVQQAAEITEGEGNC